MFSHVTGWSSWRWPQKEVNSTVTIRWLLWKLEHLLHTPWLATLMITVCWGNWKVSPRAGTFHVTCTVINYEITLEKCIFVYRTIVGTVLPGAKVNDFLLWVWMFERSYGDNWPFLQGCIGFDDCNAYLWAFKRSTLC